MDSCSHCGGVLPADASFCPSCGRRTDAPPVAPREVLIDVLPPEPRNYGLWAPVAILAAAAVLLVLGIVLVVTGPLVAGLIALAVAVCLLPAFVVGARRWPDTRVAQIGVSTADRVRGEAGAAGESVSAWSRAARNVARLRREQFRLRRERDAKIRRLGVSFYSDDGSADELKASAKALDERIAANQRELQQTVAGARRQTRDVRASVAPTEVIEPEHVEPPAEDEPLTREDVRADAEPKPKPAAKKRQARSR